MEPRSAGARPPRGPELTSSWEAASGLLSRSLHVTRDADAEELRAPGQDLMTLKSSLRPPDENPCFLELRCVPSGGEEILSIGVLSSARNMEVYVEEEYGGTSRGESACTVLDDSEHEKIILYKKYLKLGYSTHACKIKLLSFGEKPHVFIKKVVVHMRPSSTNSSPSFPALRSSIDLDKVQTLMESMGSKLSPRAQQLMTMVRFQQWSCVPIREQLQSVLGITGYKHSAAGQSSSTSGASEKSSSTALPSRTGLTSSSTSENSQAFTGPPDGQTANHEQGKMVPHNHALLEHDLPTAVPSFLLKRAGVTSDVPSSELLPFLQNLCSQVNHLRVGHKANFQEHTSKLRDVGVGMEEQPICSYLEKILLKNMELMEKKLMDYIDQRIYQLQEHMDAKIDLLMGFLQNPSSPPPGMPLIHHDSRERLSNGER